MLPCFLWLQHMFRRLRCFCYPAIPKRCIRNVGVFVPFINSCAAPGSLLAAEQALILGVQKLDRRKPAFFPSSRLRRVHRRRPDAVLEERQRVPEHRWEDIPVPVPHPEIPYHHQAGFLQQHRWEYGEFSISSASSHISSLCPDKSS